MEGQYGLGRNRCPHAVVLKRAFDGFTLDVHASVVPAGTDEVDGRHLSCLQFTAIGDRQREALRRGQTASVTWPDWNLTMEARVE
ncbi:MAG: hypothetical protein ACFB6R_06595 [Alphaproteobacteria bacterium]